MVNKKTMNHLKIYNPDNLDGPVATPAPAKPAKPVRPMRMVEANPIKQTEIDGQLIIEFASGTKAWYLDSKLHRTDGPAVEYGDGSSVWYLNGKCHRTDGPAVEHYSGTKSWFINGKRHREDGPAIERTNGNNEWYLKGKRQPNGTPKAELQNKLKSLKQQKAVLIAERQSEAGHYEAATMIKRNEASGTTLADINQQIVKLELELEKL